MLQSSRSVSALVLCFGLIFGLGMGTPAFAKVAKKKPTASPSHAVESASPRIDMPVNDESVLPQVPGDENANGTNKPPESTLNVRLSPLGLIGGFYSAALDVKVTEGLTLGPVLSYLNIAVGDLSVKVTGVGVRANFYLGRPAFTDGWIVSPFANYVSVSAKDLIAGLPAEASDRGYVFGASGGYQWIWEHFNVNAGVGAAFSTVSKVTVKSNSGTERPVNARTGDGLFFDVSAGWAF